MASATQRSATRRLRRDRAAEPAAGRRLPDILQALDEEHHFQQRLLKLLEKQVAHLNQRQPPDYEVMHGVMRYMTNYPDRFHHPKEDLVFGKVVDRDPTLEPQVSTLLQEHGTIVARGAELLALIDRCRADPAQADTNALRKSAHAYIGQLRRHMDAETLRYFPLAQRVLRRADWADVAARMEPILDPVFGEEVADGFHTLRAHAEHAAAATAPRRAASGGWTEAAAAMESFMALLGGGTKANAALSVHYRKAFGVNAKLLRDLLGRQPLERRWRLARRACAQNSRMAGDVRQELRGILSEAFVAARRPYRDEATMAARLSRACARLWRPVRHVAGEVRS
jgi:hemerythrin-like domain-containing protein